MTDDPANRLPSLSRRNDEIEPTPLGLSRSEAARSEVYGSGGLGGDVPEALARGAVKPKCGGRSPAQKGYRLENETRLFLCAGGLDCKRVPLSGSGDEKGDLRLVTGWGQTLKGECKSRAKLADWIVNALGEHDFVVLKQDRGETLVMVRLPLFRNMAQ